MPKLSGVQQRIQAARLMQAKPSLGAAYAQALARWEADPVLRLLGLPVITECYRSVGRQDELYAQGRTKPGKIVTYKRGGESKHNWLPCSALDVAFLLPNGETSWSGLLLSKFARLIKAADARVHWGGDWPGFKDWPHFEV
ncbi:M15 family metallopeptidase [Hymenobacter sp. BT770]|uniref:M15 family metallopeptidase n=1 Tax=Hymenobacter sp. BT770 TaxID=2886942 RepID=UPI001D11891E|nr:M15 family metallopeptidase [Hymenobacter sp. BT770]MCC3154585.1 M15 family metallopeptidase [Hymenobacter sp. BT770]MDO3416639.1 M15 family metallopeptidase [Hymenobacter sp. BT770]